MRGRSIGCRGSQGFAWRAVAALLVAGCSEVVAPSPAHTRFPVGNQADRVAVERVDLLFMIDNSGSMRDNQLRLMQQFGVMVDPLISPPVDPATMRPRYPAVRSLHVGVISSDLGTPGSTVPSCANSDVGDDSLLNPIRNGLAMRTHEPWTTNPMLRPARCMNSRDQYPNFLSFEAASTSATDFREDFHCYAFLSGGACGLEQQLEAIYRAVVLRDARERPGNTDPNAGFLREDSLVGLVVLSDEEDGSVRDCRYAERAQPCTDALSVFDSTSSAWASSDLNLRFYLYRPGSAQDPTWPIDRYFPLRGGVADTSRGYFLATPGRPDRLFFMAITGVPINLPRRAGSTTGVDWNRLLGANPDGSDGYTEMSPEGPVSMRQANMDPSCPIRVVPACRLQGTAYDPSRPACDTTAQYFAWPSRRIVEVARRFEVYNGGHGAVTSICGSDYSGALRPLVARLQPQAPCLGAARLPLLSPVCCDGGHNPPGCSAFPECAHGDARAVPCVVRETLPSGVDASWWCTAAHGRRIVGQDAGGRVVCSVQQLALIPGTSPPEGGHGFYYAVLPDAWPSECAPRSGILFTRGDAPPFGAIAVADCTGVPGDAGGP